MMNLKNHRVGLAFVASVLLVIFICMDGFTQQAMLTGSAIGIQQAGVSQGAATVLNCSTNLTCSVSGGIATLTASGGGGGGSAGATLFAATASKTVTATSETTLIGTVSGSTTVPVNTFTAGQQLEFYASGFYSSPVTAANLTINFKVGGTTQITTGPVTVIPSVTNGVWRFYCGITTRTAGSGGTQIGNCIFETTGATLTPGEAPMQVSSAWSVNTTVTNALDLTATWSTATGSPTITSTNVAAWIPGAPVTSVFGQTGAADIPVTTTDISTPAAPASGKTKWYTKGGKLCAEDPSSTETCTQASGGSGSFVLVEQHSASNSASLNFTTCFTSTYDQYMVTGVALIPATNNVDLWIRGSIDGGATYDSGNNYNYVFTFTGVGFGPTRSDGNNQAQMKIAGSISNSTANTAMDMYFNDPLGAGFKLIHGQTVDWDANATQLTNNVSSAAYKNTSPMNAFQVLMSSGNITSGTVRCYGLAK